MKTYHRRKVRSAGDDHPRWNPSFVTPDSPVEQARKAGPCGNGDWAGFEAVYSRIAKAAEAMGRNPNAHLSDAHIDTMADLGSGHEERMKARLQWLRTYGWIV